VAAKRSTIIQGLAHHAIAIIIKGSHRGLTGRSTFMVILAPVSKVTLPFLKVTTLPRDKIVSSKLTIMKKLALVSEAAPPFAEVTTLSLVRHLVTLTCKAAKNSLSWALP
jgi:hypothetical protein